MAETPKKLKPSHPNPKHYSPSPGPSIPPTPALRRSARRLPQSDDPKTPQKSITDAIESIDYAKTPKCRKNGKRSPQTSKNPTAKAPFSPASPDIAEPKKRKLSADAKVSKSTSTGPRSVNLSQKKKKGGETKRRVYYKKVVFDGGEFEVGDDVYVKRRNDASSDDEDPEVEVCRICFKSGNGLLLECDDCLGGFHLKCIRPPLKEVPEGDWVCGFCDARKKGEKVELPTPPKGKKVRRTAREKLLSSELWASHIER